MKYERTVFLWRRRFTLECGIEPVAVICMGLCFSSPPYLVAALGPFWVSLEVRR